MGLERNDFNPDSALHNNPLVQGRGSRPFTSNPHPLSTEEYPTQKDKDLANRGIQTLEIKIAGFIGNQRGAVSAPVAFGLGFGTGSLILGTAGFFLAKEVFANPSNIEIGSFENSFNNSIPQIVPSEQVKKPKKDEVFDNRATEKTTKRNAIQMTLEEYRQIAPPTIEKDSINIPITIVSPDRQIRELGLKRGVGFSGGIRNVTVDGEVSTIKTKNTIAFSGLNKGDIVKSPITGTVFNYGPSKKNPDGTLNSVLYVINSSDENGNTILLKIFTAKKIKPIMESPSFEDYSGYLGKKEIPDGRGGTFMTDSYGLTKEIPIAIINEGDSLFEILKGDQIIMEAHSSLRENGEFRGGGANINIPTTPDGKAIMLR